MTRGSEEDNLKGQKRKGYLMENIIIQIYPLYGNLLKGVYNN